MKLKELLAVISALCMCTVYLPAMKQSSLNRISLSASAAEIVDSGTCGKNPEVFATGENLTWILDDEGILTISGTGEMKNWDIFTKVPWLKHNANIKTVIIENGVTSIGDSSFEDCSNLTSVTIPDSVTNIGKYAFDFTPWLKEKQKENPLVIVNHLLIDGRKCEGNITIPDDVIIIGEAAFENCSALTSVTIPNSITRIKSTAFSGCSALLSVTIPNSVTSIGDYAFSNCSALTSVTISESVTSIGKNAFLFCSRLASVTIKNPDCKIYDDRSGYAIPTYTTIYGYADSTAQTYAEKFDLTFITLDDESEELIQGDANGDGETDILDVIAVNKAILGTASLTDKQLKAIDFNGNGKPDPEESLTLLKYIVGLITSFTE